MLIVNTLTFSIGSVVTLIVFIVALFSRYYQLRLMSVYGMNNVYMFPQYLARVESRVMVQEQQIPVQMEAPLRVCYSGLSTLADFGRHLS